MIQEIKDPKEYITRLEQLVEVAKVLEATDIHLEEGKAPLYRYHNALTTYEENLPLEFSFFKELLKDYLKREGQSLISFQGYDESEERLYLWNLVKGSLQDFSADYGERSIRFHIYMAKGKFCCAMRIIGLVNAGLDYDEDAGLLADICKKQEGLCLITGPTGSGKSFTLASCLEHINRTRQGHIITMEDPIEYILENKLCLIHQRELGKDVESTSQGLRDALREDPDIIMIGEMRDRDTVSAALHAAETGHLVFATMHTATAAQAVGRIISLFPGEEQAEIRGLLANQLVGIICQRLMHIEKNFVVIRDILINTVAIGHLIRKGKEYQIPSVQETVKSMRTFKKSIELAEAKYGNHEQLSLLKESICE